MRTMKDMNEFRKMSAEDRDWELYETLHDVACINGKPCPDKYTTKERVINYVSMLGAFVAAILAGLGFSK